jgi:hypothetical protein
MAREQRKDVDYFPHDCTHGRKMHIIETRYGNDGYAAWFKLLEQLGKANNHYIDISDDMTLMFLTSVFKTDEEKTISILSDLAKLGAIDKFLFEEHKIIFSQKFADSIQDAYRKRKSEMFQYSDILNEINQKNGQSGGSLTEIHVNQAEVILKEKNSKVKESKEEERIENYNARKLKFSSSLEPFLKIYGKDFLNDFYKYWTEPNKSGTKFRQELERTWDLERRLDTWARNDKNFKKDTNGKPITANTKQSYEFSVDRVIETYSGDT